MDPVSIYAVGALVTTLATGAANTVSVSASLAGASIGMGAGAIGATWPVSLPALAAYGTIKGVEHVVTPTEPTKRELVAMNAKTAPGSQYLDCNTHPVPVSDIEQAGGYHAFASGEFPLKKSGSDLLKIAPENRIETSTNWRAGTVFSDMKDAIPRVTADWVGNENTEAGEVANLRACSLKNKADWGKK